MAQSLCVCVCLQIEVFSYMNDSKKSKNIKKELQFKHVYEQIQKHIEGEKQKKPKTTNTARVMVTLNTHPKSND